MLLKTNLTTLPVLIYVCQWCWFIPCLQVEVLTQAPRATTVHAIRFVDPFVCMILWRAVYFLQIHLNSFRRQRLRSYTNTIYTIQIQQKNWNKSTKLNYVKKLIHQCNIKINEEWLSAICTFINRMSLEISFLIMLSEVWLTSAQKIFGWRLDKTATEAFCCKLMLIGTVI